MMLSNYSKRRVLLHWVSAVIILWTLVSGFYVAYNPVSAPTKDWVGSFNVSLTTLLIPLFAWRLWLFVAELDLRTLEFSFSKSLALTVHTVIYLIISLVLVTGVLMMKKPISVFGLIQIPQPLADPVLIEQAFKAHILSCLALALLVALHVCAVVWHEVCGRRVLRRMAFRKCPDAIVP